MLLIFYIKVFKETIVLALFICSPTIFTAWPNQPTLRSDANSPAFGGRLTLFCLVSRSPALVHKSPAFYVHYKYWILSRKKKTDLVWDLAHFLLKTWIFLIGSTVSGALQVFSHWQRLFLASKQWFRILIVCESCKTSYNVLGHSHWGLGQFFWGWGGFVEIPGDSEKKTVSRF